MHVGVIVVRPFKADRLEHGILIVSVDALQKRVVDQRREYPATLGEFGLKSNIVGQRRGGCSHVTPEPLQEATEPAVLRGRDVSLRAARDDEVRLPPFAGGCDDAAGDDESVDDED